MSEPVRSERFIAVQGLTSSSSYTVPAGFRAVVAQITVYTDTSGIGLFGQNVYAKSLTDGWEFYHHQAGISAPEYDAQELRVVFEAGETIQVVGGSPLDVAWDVYLGGWLLTLP